MKKRSPRFENWGHIERSKESFDGSWVGVDQYPGEERPEPRVCTASEDAEKKVVRETVKEVERLESLAIRRDSLSRIR